MKKFMMFAAVASLLTVLTGALNARADAAYDKGPDRVAVTNAPAYAPVALVTLGQFERFVPDLVMTTAPADQTQTVYWVIGSAGTLTNTVGSFVPSATVHSLAVTNVTMFYGDTLLCVPSGATATTNKYWTSGRRYN